MIAVAEGLKGRDFTKVADWSGDELLRALDLADELKRAHAAGEDARLLPGRTLGMIFQKPSTRTRVSFEVGIFQLGGIGLYLAASDLQLGRGETIEDTGKVLSRYVDAIVLRTFAQETLERLARAATIPVINALSDHEHPCQAIADMQTIRQCKGRLSGLRLTYLGDGNNVAHSLLEAGALLGMHVVVATPSGYEPIRQVVRRASTLARRSGGSVEVTNDPLAAAKDADVLYTDVWASMGQELEAEERALFFKPFQLNGEVLSVAAEDAIVLHCLPAHRGEEITAEVMDGASSAVFDQVENRLHSQKALLAMLLTGDPEPR